MIARTVSAIAVLALTCCGGTVEQGSQGASGDRLPDGADAAEGFAYDAAVSDAPAPDASALDASAQDATTGPSAGDASNPGDARIDASDGGTDGASPINSASCDYVVDTAPVVMAAYASGSMPVYTKGGTIADGTYWLTGLVIYAAFDPQDATGPSYQETVEVFGTSWNNVDMYTGMTRRATETLTVQGASGTLMYTCDSLNDPILLQETVSFTFEVDGDTLLLADETDGYALTYVRQSP